MSRCFLRGSQHVARPSAPWSSGRSPAPNAAHRAHRRRPATPLQPSSELGEHVDQGYRLVPAAVNAAASRRTALADNATHHRQHGVLQTLSTEAIPQPMQPLSASIQRIAGDLPIREVLGEVLTALDGSSGLVLQAPPGAGKTTAVPLALLLHNPEYLQNSGTILVLEPRRVAAKSAARRMASLLGEEVGGTVGYRVRHDNKVSDRTRIEVVTDGVLLRRLQRDPGLEGVGAVCFDEFHERGVDSDLALTLCLDAQRLGRQDMRLVIMSATLGGGLGNRAVALMALSAGLEPSAIPAINSEGRAYAVRVSYLGDPGSMRFALEEAAAEAVVKALKDEPGDILVFLPGVGEIRSVERMLERGDMGAVLRRAGVVVLPLHGNLSPAQQDHAIRPRRNGPRRVILSTPIAESSITIDGVRVVIDSGYRRSPEYDDATAVNRLVKTRISEASAAQRAGRAGRTAPGVCMRLWDADERLQETTPPEICGADLAQLALELGLWGCPDGEGLPWLDAPEPSRLRLARELLEGLGAVDVRGRVTATGQRMARMGVHPRYAHMALRGAELGAGELAVLLASLLSEKDVLRGEGRGSGFADVRLRLDALANGGASLDYASVERIQQSCKSMLRLVKSPPALAPPQPAVQNGKPLRTSSSVSEIHGGSPALTNHAGASAASDSAAGSDSCGSSAGADAAAVSSDFNTDEDGSSGDEVDEGGEDDVFVESMDSAAVVDAPHAGRSDSSRNDHNRGASRADGSGSSSGRFDSGSFRDAWRLQADREGLVGALLAAAYPDRIARREESSGNRATFKLSSGHNVKLFKEDDPLQQSEYIAIAELSGPGGKAAAAGGNDVVRLAAGLSTQAINRYCKPMIQEVEKVFWASRAKRVLGRKQKRLGCLVLHEIEGPVTDESAVPALLKGFQDMYGVRNLGLPRELEAWRQRLCWLRRQRERGLSTPSSPTSSPDSSSLPPDLSDEGLMRTAHSWLVPHLAGVRTKNDLVKLPWDSILKGMVSRAQQQQVEQEAPSHLTMPTGTRVLLDYSQDQVMVAVRIQEVFGLQETPRLAGGRVPVVMNLLAPNPDKSLQITADLGNFWKTSYKVVRVDGKRRYPRHVWPEDPANTEATRLTKKRLEHELAQKAKAAAESPTAGGGGGGGGGKGAVKVSASAAASSSKKTPNKGKK